MLTEQSWLFFLAYPYLYAFHKNRPQKIHFCKDLEGRNEAADLLIFMCRRLTKVMGHFWAHMYCCFFLAKPIWWGSGNAPPAGLQLIYIPLDLPSAMNPGANVYIAPWRRVAVSHSGQQSRHSQNKWKLKSVPVNIYRFQFLHESSLSLLSFLSIFPSLSIFLSNRLLSTLSSSLKYENQSLKDPALVLLFVILNYDKRVRDIFNEENTVEQTLKRRGSEFVFLWVSEVQQDKLKLKNRYSS